MQQHEDYNFLYRGSNYNKYLILFSMFILLVLKRIGDEKIEI